MDKPTTDFLVQALATLTGAMAAFSLEALRQFIVRRRTRILSLKRAMFTLLEQREHLLNYKRQMLDPVRDHPLRAFVLHPSVDATPTGTIDVDALGYLLDENGELLHRIINANTRFRALSRVIEERNATHNRFQQATEDYENRARAARVEPPSGELTVAEIQHAAGWVITKQLRQMTDGIYDHADDALANNARVQADLLAFAKKRFWREKFFRIEDLPELKP